VEPLTNAATGVTDTFEGRTQMRLDDPTGGVQRRGHKHDMVDTDDPVVGLYRWRISDGEGHAEFWRSLHR